MGGRKAFEIFKTITVFKLFEGIATAIAMQREPLTKNRKPILI